MYKGTIFLILLFIVSCKDEPIEVEIFSKDKLSQQFQFVLYDGLTEDNIEKVKEELAENAQRIIDDLQITSMPKVTVKIWNSVTSFEEAMLKDLGVVYSGATGYIFSPTELRFLMVGNAPLTAVHEFAHLVSMQVNRTIPNNPRWLWEAVALYESSDLKEPKSLSYMVSGNYPSIAELNVNYNNSNYKIYSVGYTLFEYVLFEWGKEKAIALIKSNGNLQLSLEVTTSQFESGWYKFVEEKYL